MKRNDKREMLRIGFPLMKSKALMVRIVKIMLDIPHDFLNVSVSDKHEVFILTGFRHPQRTWEILLKKVGRPELNKAGVYAVHTENGIWARRSLFPTK